MDSRRGCSRMLPALLSRPPMITRSGLMRLQRPATATPISRPASEMARRHRTSPADAPRELGERAQVGVVLYVHWKSKSFLHRVGDAYAHPAGQDRRRTGRPALAVDRSGNADAGADDARPIDARLAQHLRGHLRREVQRFLGPMIDVQVTV